MQNYCISLSLVSPAAFSVFPDPHLFLSLALADRETPWLKDLSALFLAPVPRSSQVTEGRGEEKEEEGHGEFDIPGEQDPAGVYCFG